MGAQKDVTIKGTSHSEEEVYLKRTLEVVKANVKNYEDDVAKMQEEIDEMLDHYHDNDTEVYTLLSTGVQQLNKRKLATGRIKPVFFCQIFFMLVLYMLYYCGIIGSEVMLL